MEVIGEDTAVMTPATEVSEGGGGTACLLSRIFPQYSQELSGATEVVSGHEKAPYKKNLQQQQGQIKQPAKDKQQQQQTQHFPKSLAALAKRASSALSSFFSDSLWLGSGGSSTADTAHSRVHSDSSSFVHYKRICPPGNTCIFSLLTHKKNFSHPPTTTRTVPLKP